MPAFRLVIEYDGKPFSGWQVQPGRETVQGRLQKALFTILSQRITLQVAGRTDAGVHAKGQVASFAADTRLSPGRIARSLSALAGPHISVVNACIVPEKFNARFDAKGKHYRYLILSRPAPSPFLSATSLHIKQPLDILKMQKTALLFKGRHDFNGFRANDCTRKNTVRQLFDVTVNSNNAGLISIDVKGDGFLKNMVRIIAGTIIDTGREKLPVEIVSTVFLERDRKMAGQTAPAHGLTLMEVYYE